MNKKSLGFIFKVFVIMLLIVPIFKVSIKAEPSTNTTYHVSLSTNDDTSFLSYVGVSNPTPEGEETITVIANKATKNNEKYIPYQITITPSGEEPRVVSLSYDYIQDKATYEYTMNNKDVSFKIDYTKAYLNITASTPVSDVSLEVVPSILYPTGDKLVSITAYIGEKSSGILTYYYPYSFEVTPSGGTTTTIYSPMDYMTCSSSFDYQLSGSVVSIKVNYIESYYAEEITELTDGICTENISSQNLADKELIRTREQALLNAKSDTRTLYLITDQDQQTELMKVYPDIPGATKDSFSIKELLTYSDAGTMCFAALGGTYTFGGARYQVDTKEFKFIDRAIEAAKVTKDKTVVMCDGQVENAPSTNTYLNFTGLKKFEMNRDATIVLYDGDKQSGEYTLIGEKYDISGGNFEAQNTSQYTMKIGDATNPTYNVVLNNVSFSVSMIEVTNIANYTKAGTQYPIFISCSLPKIQVNSATITSKQVNAYIYDSYIYDDDLALDIYGKAIVDGTLIEGNIKVENGGDLTLYDVKVDGNITKVTGGNIKILSGYFTKDPSEYVDVNSIVVPVKNGIYNYCVSQVSQDIPIGSRSINTFSLTNNLKGESKDRLDIDFDSTIQIPSIYSLLKAETKTSIEAQYPGYTDYVYGMQIKLTAEEGDLISTSDQYLIYSYKFYVYLYGRNSDSEKYAILNKNNPIKLNNSDLNGTKVTFKLPISEITINSFYHLHDDGKKDKLVEGVDYEVISPNAVDVKLGSCSMLLINRENPTPAPKPYVPVNTATK